MAAITEDNNDAAAIDRVDVAVIGSGLAGIMAAIAASDHGASVVILTRGEFGSGNTELASGGLAAVTGLDPADSPAQHLADMERAACGLMFRDIAEAFVTEAGAAILRLEELGVRFARDSRGLRLFMAPGHSRARSVRCEGGGTAHLLGPLIERVAERSIRTMCGVAVTDIVRSPSGQVCGIRFVDSHGVEQSLDARAVVLASGGMGQLFPLTSNSPQANGTGYYLALKAGATLMDLEFVQFTPTSLAHPPEVRGISTGGGLLAQPGVRLLNARGERFMSSYDDRGEAATRDVVARAIDREVKEGRGTDHDGVYVDLSKADPGAVAQVSGRFLRSMSRIGIDPYKTLVEVAPDVHFAMGGVAIDSWGSTGTPGLYAAGEVAAGLHGATRLNSNGLTEALVFGTRAGKAAAKSLHEPSGKSPRPTNGSRIDMFLSADPRRLNEPVLRSGEIEIPATRRVPRTEPVEPCPETGRLRHSLHQLAWQGAGIERDSASIEASLKRHAALGAKLGELISSLDDAALRFDAEAAYVMTGLVLQAARARTESRGSHFRTDFPEMDERWANHICFSVSTPVEDP